MYLDLPEKYKRKKNWKLSSWAFWLKLWLFDPILDAYFLFCYSLFLP